MTPQAGRNGWQLYLRHNRRLAFFCGVIVFLEGAMERTKNTLGIRQIIWAAVSAVLAIDSAAAQEALSGQELAEALTGNVVIIDE